MGTQTLDNLVHACMHTNAKSDESLRDDYRLSRQKPSIRSSGQERLFSKEIMTMMGKEKHQRTVH